MAQFNLNDYETVEERLQRALEAHDDLRVVTLNRTTEDDRERHTWVVETRVYMNAGDQANDLPKGTGWAYEVDGQNGPANKFSALENCESSSLGRALKHAFGARSVTAEEMSKVNRGVSPRDWVAEASRLKTRDELAALYVDAKAGGASAEQLAEVKRLGESHSVQSKSDGSARSGGGSSKE